MANQNAPLSLSYPAPGKVDFLEVDASSAIAACRAYTAGRILIAICCKTNYDKAHQPYNFISTSTVATC